MADQSSKRCLGVFTSGGDSQGMNAALRSVIRIALHKGMRAFVIEEGYKGLVEGGKHIRECQWGSFSYIMQKGGTVIGTARCKEFMERAGRLKAAENLVKSGINSLVVIGGDGSLTGANLFKEEWNGLLEELVKTGRLKKEEIEHNSYLNIAGLVGSIDNDMCGTDMTIGTDSALHRILEAMDCISSTASSHQRCFVMEIMGRNCGYLTLMAGIAGSADWVLVPENPPKPGWEDAMCDRLSICRSAGKRLNVILVAEGAVDMQNKPIKVEDVKNIIDSKLKFDTRITVLGHVQRGGKPSAYDRIIATRMGAEASLALARAQGEIPPIMIATKGNQIVQEKLMECVTKTRSINQALKDRDFEKVVQLRSSNFTRSLEALKRLEACECGKEIPSKRYRLAVLNVGAPAGGTNNCNRAFIRFLLFAGHEVYGIHDGFEGLANGGAIHKMNWIEVSDWGSIGGSSLGTNRTIPTESTLSKIAAQLEKYSIQGLMVIGGFEAFEGIIKVIENRSKYPSFRIPIVQVAATISNNVPGTEYSLGSDTALNTIVSAMDVLKQSATASRKRVFVVETMGGYCGYLASLGALAGGADNAYIFEEPFTLKDLQRDVARLVSKFSQGNFERGIILRNELCNENYTTKFITQMLAEEGKEYFITRTNVLGHLQQGDYPSPFDRIMGTKFATEAVDLLLSQIPANMIDDKGTMNAIADDTACVMGLVGKEIKATPINSLLDTIDFKHRIPNDQWWMKLRPLIMVLSHHMESEFNGEENQA